MKIASSTEITNPARNLGQLVAKVWGGLLEIHIRCGWKQQLLKSDYCDRCLPYGFVILFSGGHIFARASSYRGCLQGRYSKPHGGVII